MAKIEGDTLLTGFKENILRCQQSWTVFKLEPNNIYNQDMQTIFSTKAKINILCNFNINVFNVRYTFSGASDKNVNILSLSVLSAAQVE